MITHVLVEAWLPTMPKHRLQRDRSASLGPISYSAAVRNASAQFSCSLGQRIGSENLVHPLENTFCLSTGFSVPPEDRLTRTHPTHTPTVSAHGFNRDFCQMAGRNAFCLSAQGGAVWQDGRNPKTYFVFNNPNARWAELCSTSAANHVGI
jgi:hypothetical protein